MDGVHDLGGMHGFGPIPYEKDEPLFHEPWEARLYALRRALTIPMFATVDEHRYALEQLPPARYLGLSYYERWLAVFQDALIANEVLDPDEMRDRFGAYEGNPDAPVPQRTDPELTTRVVAGVFLRPNVERDAGATRFQVGDRVLARNIHPKGHTRLPGYARGKQGEIVRINGICDLPDAIVAHRDPEPQAVYSVRFEAAELWGEAAESNASVYIDLWDSYLEPA